MKADRKPIIVAFTIAIILHMFGLLFSMGVELPGIQTVVQAPRRLFQIKTLQSKLPDREVIDVSDIDYSKRIRFQSPVNSQAKNMSFDQKQAQKKANTSFKDQEISKPIIARSATYIQQVKKKKDYSLLQEKAKRDELAHRMGADELKDKTKILTPKEIIEQEGITEDFFDKMPGFTPDLNPQIKEVSVEIDQSNLQRGYTPLVSKEATSSDLKSYLESQLRVYEDPKTKQKYYEVSIRLGKDGKELPTLSKEIVFLIDCSKSTTYERLQEFKKGLEYSLQNLNKEDRFNVVAFKKSSVRFKKESIVPDEKNIAEALKFVENLSVGTRTDAYGALQESINAKMKQAPSYIILLSDGHPTQGITDPSEIIHKISALNRGSRSIFAFSGGLRVNRYLLDFITYKNRGWTEYSYRTHLIGKNLSDMYNKIKNPIILDLRYLTSGLNQSNMYPKILPDFFKDIEFTLYGTYEDEEEFALQLLGNLGEQPVELIVNGKFSNAIQGNEDIAQNWAFNKVYDLIGELQKGKDNTELLKEIKELSDLFKIKTPYLESFQLN